MKAIHVLAVGLFLCLFSTSFMGLLPPTAMSSPTNYMFTKQPTQDIQKYGSILAGSSSTIITPDLSKYQPIYLAGFDRGRTATAIHDNLWSRCCCFSIQNTTVAIVSVDLIGLMYPEFISIQQQVLEEIPLDLLIISSTHNHEGPDVIGLWGSNLHTGVHWEWYQQTLKDIAQGVITAYHTMEPAGIKIGHGLAPGFSRDSREPIVMDEQVETIQFVRPDESSITTMVFYSSHPEVLWNKNTLITADYPHYLYEHIEQETNGSAIFVSGAIGGLITPKVQNHTFHDAKIYGESLANISLHSLEETSIIWDTSLRVDTKKLLIPLTNPVFRFAACINLINRPFHSFRLYIESCVNIIELGEQGSLAQIVTVPGEDFPENWLELKDKLHASHKICIGLGNDELGYIVPIEAFNWQDYEESMSASKYLDHIIHQSLEEMLTILDK